MGKAGNDLSISHFPTAEDYAATCDIYIDSIRRLLPNTKIAVSAGNFGSSNPRAQYWNEALYNMVNAPDAFRWSAFFYLILSVDFVMPIWSGILLLLLLSGSE